MQDLMTEPITFLKTDAEVLVFLCHGIQWIEFIVQPICPFRTTVDTL